jgi:beta-glucosidase
MTSTQKHLDHALSIDERVDYLLAEMTIEEQVAQLWGVWATDLIDSNRRFDAQRAANHLPHGAGQIARIGATALLPPDQSAALANEIQRYLVEGTRLGIPAIVHEESCAGYLAKGAMTFPQAIGLAATWDPDLIQQMAAVIRQQMRAAGAHQTLAPVLDIARDPRWGRIEETFGEDPFLVSAIGSAYIRGMQGETLADGIIATAKHFLGYGLSEGGMNWAPAHIPEREMREIFLTPFAAAIKGADVGSVMNAYQELDGEPAGSSRKYMVEWLRDELGFDGYVSSDYFTIDMFMNYHYIAASKAEAARYGLEAGIDVELPAANCYGQPLLDALASGAIDAELVRVSARRVLRKKIELGLFEQPYVNPDAALVVYNTPEQLALSREIARKSCVLLKNDADLLPLSPALGTIAVIGPNADNARHMQGDYHYPGHLESMTALGENMDAPAPADMIHAAWDEHMPPSTTILAGIQASVSPDTQVLYAPGCEVLGDDTTGFAEAVAIAQQADVAVVVVGDRSGLGLGCTVGEAIDRATLDLPGVQQQLVEAVHATGTPVVVVLVNGRSYTLNWLDAHIPAILEAWLPAQEGGAAVADVLFGAANPGGRLPVSFPRSVGQIPLYYNHKPSGGRSHWYGEYIDMPTTPLYPFGHGLSYTQFAYSNLRITPLEASPAGTVDIQVEVENTGPRAGDEVVQLYVHDVLASVTRPVQALKGFARVTLQPGEHRTVTFALDVAHLGFYNRAMAFVVEPGEIEVMIGGSAADIRLRETFTITGSVTPVKQVFYTPVTVV